MPPLLHDRLADIRSRLRRALVVYGLGWVTAVALGATLVCCLTDWFVHLDDVGVRLIFAIAVLVTTTWVGFRYLVTPLRVPVSDVDLALRIEERFPGFNDSLASTVQFLERERDPRIGSPTLQQLVVRGTMARLVSLDTSDLLDTREIRRIAIIAVGIVLAALAIFSANPTRAWLALRRLYLPFSAPAWPRLTNLILLNEDFRPVDDTSEPMQLARGDTLKLFAENRTGHLPDKVLLEIRGEDGRTSAEAMRPMSVNRSDGLSREVAVGQLNPLKGEIQFRAVGGDDTDMPWRRLRVIPPPVLETLEVTLTPPAYSLRPVENLPVGKGDIEGLIGTRVDLVGKSSKPLQQGILSIGDDYRDDVAIETDGRTISASFLITTAGVSSWWLELLDEEDLTNLDPTRYEIRGITDSEPEVRIDVPVADLQVTAEAILPVHVTTRDDLGLREIRLSFRKDGAEEGRETMIPLFGDKSRPKEQEVTLLWNLAELQLSEDSRIVFHAEATDDYDVPELSSDDSPPTPRVGRSSERILTIVSKERKTEELARRQAGLLDDLERAFKQQKQAREQVGELELQAEKAGEFRPEDLDSLQRTEIIQRDIAAQLRQPATGIERRARDLLDELRGNHLDDSQSERRLGRIAEDLERLGEENLPAIEQELTQARKGLQTREKSSTNKPEARAAAPREGRVEPELALHQVAENQEAVLDSLSEILKELSRWRTEHDAGRDLADLIRQQVDINEKTSDLAKQTLTRPRASLAPQEQADLAKMAARQRKQAEQVDEFKKRVQDKIDTASDANSSANSTLQDTLEMARQQGVAEQMRAAAGQLSENRMGEASRSQEQSLEKLRELEATLVGGSRDSDTEQLVKKLQKSESDLNELRSREEELLRKLGQAAEIVDRAQRQAELARLKKEQMQLRDETVRMARRLQRLNARRPSAAADRAAQRMQRAGEQLDQEEESEAAREQQEALDDLEQAQRDLSRERRRAEEQLAREQLDRIASELAAMIDREQQVVEETRRLEGIRQSAGKFNRAQLLALRDLTGAQRNLKEDTNHLAEKLTAAEVFAQALRGAARNMQIAIELLEARDTGESTQQAAEQARLRFVDLNDALKQDQDQNGKQADSREEQGGGSRNRSDEGPQTDGIPAFTQLKLLLALQRELLERTRRISEFRAAGKPLTSLQQAELESLAREQGELADLARNLSHFATEPDDDDASGTSTDAQNSDRETGSEDPVERLEKLPNE